MPQASAGAHLRARDGAMLAITDSTALTACYFFAQALKEGRWLIVRPGTSSVVLTSDAGLRALQLFRSGATLAAVKQDLAATAAVTPESIDLSAFVSMFAGAGMFKSAGGVRLAIPPLRFCRWCRHLFQIALYPAIFAVLNRLPLGLRERCLFHSQWLVQGRFIDDTEAARLSANLALLFPSASAAVRGETAREFQRQRVRQHIAFLTTAKQPAEVARWIDAFVETDSAGVGRFREALALGRGAVVVSFHFGSYWLLPAALLKLGVSVHVLIGSQPAQQRVIECAGPEGRRAVLTFHDRSLRGLAALATAVANGGVAVIFADTHGSGDTPRQRFVHDTWGKSKYSDTEVVLLDHRFPVEAGLTWLHQLVQSPVIPVVLYPRADSWKVKLEFGHAESQSEEAIVRSVYSQMEGWIRDQPHHWSYLTSFPHGAHHEPAADAPHSLPGDRS